MIIQKVDTRLFQHNFGSYMSQNNSHFGYIPIPKNASSTLKKFFKGTVSYKFDYNYYTESNREFVVCLRDPLDRWFTGIAEYFDKGFKEIDISNKEMLKFIFTRKIFDAHTEPQVNFLANLYMDNIYFFKFGNNLIENIGKFAREKLLIDQDRVHINMNESWRNVSMDTPKQKNIDILKNYAILNPYLVEEIKNYYSEDYKLFNGVTYYGTN